MLSHSVIAIPPNPRMTKAPARCQQTPNLSLRMSGSKWNITKQHASDHHTVQPLLHSILTWDRVSLREEFVFDSKAGGFDLSYSK